MESFTDKEGQPRSNLSLIASMYTPKRTVIRGGANTCGRELRRPFARTH